MKKIFILCVLGSISITLQASRFNLATRFKHALNSNNKHVRAKLAELADKSYRFISSNAAREAALEAKEKARDEALERARAAEEAYVEAYVEVAYKTGKVREAHKVRKAYKNVKVFEAYLKAGRDAGAHETEIAELEAYLEEARKDADAAFKALLKAQPNSSSYYSY